MRRFVVDEVRQDFPILAETARGKPLVYLDNAASSQKPRAMLEALDAYYRHANANVHRGVHDLSERATAIYERAREGVQRFLGARSSHEIVFVRGTTEAINLVASSYAAPRLGVDDEVLISAIEHHSNIVPWQMACKKRGARLRVIPMNHAGELVLDDLESLLTPRTRLVAVTHMSNALGTLPPVREIVRRAHQRGIPVLLDGAQAAPHVAIDVQELDCDFYVFSGHKAYAPMGIGALYAKREHLEAMEPYQGGGEMIRTVSFAESSYNDVPWRFEAGTPNVEGAAGLLASLEYLRSFDPAQIAAHEDDLLRYATAAIGAVDGVTLVGTAREKAGIVGFTFAGVHPHDVGTILDCDGIAVRAGHHCAQPVMAYYGVDATVRVSLALYNTRDEIDAVVRALEKVKEIFG
ncbi:MAG: cysteine desulfurase [Planctomycetota bacterium]